MEETRQDCVKTVKRARAAGTPGIRNSEVEKMSEWTQDGDGWNLAPNRWFGAKLSKRVGCRANVALCIS